MNEEFIQINDCRSINWRYVKEVRKEGNNYYLIIKGIPGKVLIEGNLKYQIEQEDIFCEEVEYYEN